LGGVKWNRGKKKRRRTLAYKGEARSLSEERKKLRPSDPATAEIRGDLYRSLWGLRRGKSGQFVNGLRIVGISMPFRHEVRVVPRAIGCRTAAVRHGAKKTEKTRMIYKGSDERRKEVTLPAAEGLTGADQSTHGQVYLRDTRKRDEHVHA